MYTVVRFLGQCILLHFNVRYIDRILNTTCCLVFYVQYSCCCVQNLLLRLIKYCKWHADGIFLVFRTILTINRDYFPKHPLLTTFSSSFCRSFMFLKLTDPVGG
jgi:hypothetical protein